MGHSMKDLCQTFPPPTPLIRIAEDGDGAAPPLPSAIFAPQVRLLGRIDETLLQSFHDQLATVPKGEGEIAVELMTFGGDAEIGRRLALEFRLAGTRLHRRLVFI